MMKYFYAALVMSAITLNGKQMPATKDMSVEEKIGQLFIVATVADPDNPVSRDVLFGRAIKNIPSIKDKAELKYLIEHYHIGGIIFLGKSSAEKQYEMTSRLISFNQQYDKIPLLFALDAEWGPAMRIEDATKFPFNITLGAIRDNGIIKEMGFMIGTMLQALHIGINFAPVADCNTNPLNPIINRRSFGENPAIISHCVRAFINGLQDAGVAACAKHFPGHGDTDVDTHTGLARVNHSRNRLFDIELVPFKAAIHAHTKAIMTAHILVASIDADKPATVSPLIMTSLLRDDLAYDGLLVTDALDMNAITKLYKPEEGVLLALQAGNDLMVAPVDVPQAVEQIKEALKTGLITMQELDKHVERILELKEWIEEQHNASEPSPKAIAEILNSKESQELSKRLFQKAITLVRNEHILPITSKSEKLSIVAIGTNVIPPFATYLQQTHHCTTYLLPSTSSPDQYKEALQTISGTVIIGVFGLTYGKQPFGVTPEAQQFIAHVCTDHKKVAVILFGNPYALRLFQDAPALIEAYEDHPYAQEAAAQIVVGERKPEGILPITASDEFCAGRSISY